MLVTAIFASLAISELPDLGAPEFSERENAQRELVEQFGGEPNQLSELLRRYAYCEDPEEAFRLKESLFTVMKAEVPQSGSGFIGIEMGQIGPQEDLRVRINAVIPGTPAERAGLQVGDEIQKANQVEIRTIPELQREIGNLAPGSRVSLHLLREGAPLVLEVQLMNANAVEGRRRFDRNTTRVNEELAEELLREDFEVWLGAQLKELDEDSGS